MSRPQKPPHISRTWLAEIIGEEGLTGQRMQAGAILDQMDLVAADAAIRHAQRPVVTLAFDRVELTQPILHQDLVRLEGEVVAVGNSSMTILVQGFRQDQLSRDFVPIQKAFVTMVALDQEGRPDRTIPTLGSATAQEQAWANEAATWKQLNLDCEQHLAQLKAQPLPPVEELEEPSNREKSELLRPEQTVVQMRRHFMPRHNNLLGTVFGGDILLWLDRVATYTARLFTRNPHMVTLAMDRIFFRAPIRPTDWVELTARVTYVRRFTLEVEIQVVLQRPLGNGETEVIPSHSGTFTVLNYDLSGFKRPIITGLNLKDAPEEDLWRYHLARQRHQFWREHRGSPADEPPRLSMF